MMGKEQVLRIEPLDVIKFRGPFTETVTSELHITNPTSQRVAFKVKTTAPKRYCVRPNGAILEPGGKVTVQVMLQPADYDPIEKQKHKFMIQSVVVPDGTPAEPDSVWKNAQPDALMETKLRCAFENSSQPSVLPSPVAPAAESIGHQSEKASFTSAADPQLHMSSKVSMSNYEDQISKLQAENKSLKFELSEVRQELTNSKEEGVRLRKIAVSDAAPAPPPPPVIIQAPKPSRALQLLLTLLALILGVAGGVATVKFGYV